MAFGGVDFEVDFICFEAKQTKIERADIFSDNIIFFEFFNAIVNDVAVDFEAFCKKCEGGACV